MEINYKSFLIAGKEARLECIKINIQGIGTINIRKYYKIQENNASNAKNHQNGEREIIDKVIFLELYQHYLQRIME